MIVVDTKIKIFSSHSANELEEKVNDFIHRHHMVVVDILQSTMQNYIIITVVYMDR